MTVTARLRNLEPSSLLWIGLATVLVFLVLYPLFWLLFGSVYSPRTGELTLVNFAAAYGQPRYLTAIRNSLLMGLSVTALCAIIAVPMAWAVSRTNMPAKALVRVLTLGTFVTPPYLGALAWILLAGPNAGWLNVAFKTITGAETGIFNIFSFPGLVFIIAIYSYPYLFLFTSAALDTVSSEMEDAANILGAGRWRTTLRVTLPLVLPAILGGAIITFLESIALFGSPAMIAIPARYNIVTTQMLEFFSYPVRVQVAEAYALPLLMVTVLLYLIQQRLIGRRGHVTMTGKGGERRPIELGRWRWVVTLGCLLISTLSVLLPLVVLVEAAFSRAWARGLSFDNFTGSNFHFILVEQQATAQAMTNTFLYAGAAASFALGLAMAIAYIVHRQLIPFGGVLSFLCLAPFVVPGIVLAIGFYDAYAGRPFHLYGTAAIMILAFTTRFLPIAYANAGSAIRGLNPEMEEAVRILGGGRFLALRRVVVPLLKGSLASAWLLVFIPATREISTAVFLYGPNTRVMSVMLLNLTDEGRIEAAAALGLLLLLAIIVIVLASRALLGRDFMVRRPE